MSEQERSEEESEEQTPETLKDLDVPEEQREDVKGGEWPETGDI